MAENEDNTQAEGELADDGNEQGGLDLQELGDRALAYVQREATTHPLRTVGIAMGIGYVLGGGVPRLVVRLGMIAAGRALSQAATIEGMRMVAGVLRDRESGEDAGADLGATGTEEQTSTRRNGHRRKRGGQARQARHD